VATANVYCLCLAQLFEEVTKTFVEFWQISWPKHFRQRTERNYPSFAFVHDLPLYRKTRKRGNTAGAMITTGAALPLEGAPRPVRRLGGSSLPAGPAHLGDLVADIAVIPAQPPRDLVYRDAANEHLAQCVHLRIRPLSAGIHGQRFVGPLRIED
jgi:hypothetical protein